MDGAGVCWSRVRIALLCIAVVVLAACGASSEPPPGRDEPTIEVPDTPAPIDTPPPAEAPSPAPPPVPDDPAGPDPDPDPPILGDAERMLELVNQARATDRTCGATGWFAAAAPLALEPRLSAAAQWYSDDMHNSGAWNHIGSDGSTLGVRVDRTGYPWRALGENIAKGFTTPEAVMHAWLGSAGHCANIMGPQFTELGFGRTGVSWTQVFGRR